MSANTCGRCRHWHKLPADAANLGGQARGECRQGPPTLYVLPAASAGGVSAGQLVTAYPRPTEDFPACGQFAPATLPACDHGIPADRPCGLCRREAEWAATEEVRTAG